MNTINTTVNTAIVKAHAWLITRTGGPSAQDRAEAPIPTAWITIAVAALAVVVAAAVTGAGQRAIAPINDMFK